MKKLLRNKGLVEREGSLRKGEFTNCFISFPEEKHVFITIGIIYYSLLFIVIIHVFITIGMVNIHTCCNQ